MTFAISLVICTLKYVTSFNNVKKIIPVVKINFSLQKIVFVIIIAFVTVSIILLDHIKMATDFMTFNVDIIA